MLNPDNKALLSMDDLEGIVFSGKAKEPSILTENEDLASFIVKMSADQAAAPIMAAPVDKYAAMTDLLRGKATEAAPMLPRGTNEILNRVVNKLYDLAQDIKLTMDGY
jgi:hypothetical protein